MVCSQVVSAVLLFVSLAVLGRCLCLTPTPRPPQPLSFMATGATPATRSPGAVSVAFGLGSDAVMVEFAVVLGASAAPSGAPGLSPIYT